MNHFVSRWCASGLRGLMILVAATGWTRAAAQVAFNPSAQLWPSSADAARPSVAVFGSAVACTLLTCDPAPSFGLDMALLGPLRVAVAGPRSTPQLGLSYTWRHIDIATRVGRGASIVRSLKAPNMILHVDEHADSLSGRIQVDSSWVPAADTSPRGATKWTSAEARVTWREDRWWVDGARRSCGPPRARVGIVDRDAVGRRVGTRGVASRWRVVVAATPAGHAARKKQIERRLRLQRGSLLANTE